MAIVCLAVGACGGRSAEGMIIGKWEFDREANKQAGLVATDDIKIVYEFNADGTGSETIGGDPVSGTWKLVKNEGGATFIEFASKAERRSKSIRITMLDSDHLKIYNSHDFGECRLKRAK
jgi:hypothetical protein